MNDELELYLPFAEEHGNVLDFMYPIMLSFLKAKLWVGAHGQTSIQCPWGYF